MMKNLNKKFKPIRLIKTNVVNRKGYYYGEVTRVNTHIQGGNQILKVEFRITKGKYREFPIITTFSRDRKSKARISHLCNAVGITVELDSPEQLLGKVVKLRVVPYYNNYMGRTYLNHKITRFHPVNTI